MAVPCGHSERKGEETDDGVRVKKNEGRMDEEDNDNICDRRH
jgi:hypothetical protein